ncbi:MAG: substrate-binding domain-containing protein, partial [Methanolinea sp.]
FLLLVGCFVVARGPPPPSHGSPRLVLATTTSMYDSGLLDVLEPLFEERHGIDLLVTSQGTGKAFELARRGDCDVIIVHSPEEERAFIAAGHGTSRRCFAYNRFVIAGPVGDPAGIRGAGATEAFRRIAAAGMAGRPGVAFVSRGDGSGTHTVEKSIWESAGYNYTNEIRGSGPWYVETGRGMGETLQLAGEKGAYTLSDTATFLVFRGRGNLVPLVEGEDIPANVYSVITVTPRNGSPERQRMAEEFAHFLLSPEIQEKIGEYGLEEYGTNLFSPVGDRCGELGCDCAGPASPPGTPPRPA